MVPKVAFSMVLGLILVLVLDLGAQEPRFADLLLVPNSTGAKARGCCVLRGDEIRGEGATIRQLEVKPAGPLGPSYRASDTKESIFNTVQSQLGMRLERVTAPIEVLIIERAEKPQ